MKNTSVTIPRSTLDHILWAAELLRDIIERDLRARSISETFLARKACAEATAAINAIHEAMK